MPPIVLFESEGHRNILLEDPELGSAVPSNVHLIVHGAQGILLDPGGPKAFRFIYPAVLAELRRAKLTHLFFSHQDPDIIAGANAWLTQTTAHAYVSRLWTRFVPHFGLDRVMAESLVPIPDEGGVLALGDLDLLVLPAHFIHSPGNFQVYDPASKILYSGDLGASLGPPGAFVEDFDAHLRFMVGFHRRYMAGRRAMQVWARLVRQLDIETIAPQHGSIFRGKALVQRFIDWAEGLDCGIDLLEETALPTERLPEGNPA